MVNAYKCEWIIFIVGIEVQRRNRRDLQSFSSSYSGCSGGCLSLSGRIMILPVSSSSVTFLSETISNEPLR